MITVHAHHATPDEFLQAVGTLDAAIDRRRRVGDLRIFRTIKQAVITPAADRLGQFCSRRRPQRRRAGEAEQQQKK